MSRNVSVAQLRANLADLLGAVHYRQEPVVVERNGKPFAVVISPEQYERLRRQGEEAGNGRADRATADEATVKDRPRDGRHLAGAWADLDWEELADELDRIRHESKPTPIIELDDL